VIEAYNYKIIEIIELTIKTLRCIKIVIINYMTLNLRIINISRRDALLRLKIKT